MGINGLFTLWGVVNSQISCLPGDPDGIRRILDVGCNKKIVLLMLCSWPYFPVVIGGIQSLPHIFLSSVMRRGHRTGFKPARAAAVLNLIGQTYHRGDKTSACPIFLIVLVVVAWCDVHLAMARWVLLRDPFGRYPQFYCAARPITLPQVM